MEKKHQFMKAVILTATMSGLLIAFTARISGSFVSPVQTQARQYLPQATNSQDARGTVAQAANAAFRDGLYVGKIASERGSEPHISVGRWPSREDRAAYAAGYLQGYNQPIANPTATREDN